MTTFPRLTLGVSGCLLGEKVRFDGGHKRSNFIVTILQDYADFISMCPEVAIGLGIPRPAIHLIGDSSNPRLVDVKDESLDYTQSMRKYSRNAVNDLTDISGFILKSKSPTCGMERVRVYNKHGQAQRDGVGLFARELMNTHPLLPVEEEGRLNDPSLRENFITRIFAYRRWQDVVASRMTIAKLVQFHSEHKLLLMAHNVSAYKRLGQLVANHDKLTIASLRDQYADVFMRALSQRTTPKKNTNVLMHLMGYLKKRITADDKQELLDVVEQYRLQRIPLIVPLTLMKHYFRQHPNNYVAQQVYLHPHPDEMMLRNHT